MIVRVHTRAIIWRGVTAGDLICVTMGQANYRWHVLGHDFCTPVWTYDLRPRLPR